MSAQASSPTKGAPLVNSENILKEFSSGSFRRSAPCRAFPSLPASAPGRGSCTPCRKGRSRCGQRPLAERAERFVWKIRSLQTAYWAATGKGTVFPD